MYVPSYIIYKPFIFLFKKKKKIKIIRFLILPFSYSLIIAKRFVMDTLNYHNSCGSTLIDQKKIK